MTYPPDAAPQKVRILLVDNHFIFRSGLRALLSTTPSIQIVGEASNRVDALRMLARCPVDVVVMDVDLPVGDGSEELTHTGIELARRIGDAYPDTGVLMLTMRRDPETMVSAVRAGARGYLLKGAGERELLRAIDAVAHGEAIFSPMMAQYLMDALRTENLNPAHPFPELTGREREVLTLIGQGVSNADIAERLFLSLKTVRNHVSNIFGKLNVHDRAQLIILAREAQLPTL